MSKNTIFQTTSKTNSLWNRSSNVQIPYRFIFFCNPCRVIPRSLAARVLFPSVSSNAFLINLISKDLTCFGSGICSRPGDSSVAVLMTDRKRSPEHLSGVIWSPEGVSTTIRSTSLFNCRTLPGHLLHSFKR